MNRFKVSSFLADSVEAVQGKIYALGIGWDVIYTAALPTTHSRVGLGILVEVPYTETNKDHEIQIKLVDEDGQLINDLDFTSHFNLGRPALLRSGDSQILPFAFNFDGLTFSKSGTFRWEIMINKEILGINNMKVSVIKK